MSRADSIMRQLAQTFDIKVEVDISEGPSVSTVTTRYVPNLDDTEADQDQFKDFPYIEDPSEYKTYIPIEQKVEEQGVPETPTKPLVTPPDEAGTEAGTDLGGDVGAGAEMPGTMNITGGFGQEQQQLLTSSEIGKVYEMKKIYARLTSLESYLSSTTDTSLLKMRGMVAQSMDLFETVIMNFNQYKEQINEIIVTYYKFLDMTYEILRSYYKNDLKNEY